MRKGILIGIAAGTVAIGAAAAPPIIGTITQQEFAHVRDRATAASPFVQGWEMTSFEQGYLGATATSELTVGNPDTDERLTIFLDHRIQHAPTVGTDLARIVTEPRIPEGRIRDTMRALYGDDRKPLRVNTRIDWFGTRTIHIHSPATDGMREIDGGQVEWGGLDATLKVGRGDRDLAYQVDVPGLHLQPDDGEFAGLRINAVQASGRYEETAFEHVWSGGASGEVERIELDTPNGGGFVLSGLRFSDEAGLRDDLFGFALKLSAAALESPEYQLSRLRLNLSGERIAPELLQSAQRTLANGDEPIDTDEVMARLRAAPWGEIAGHEPEIRLDTFEAHTADGRLEISARASLAAPGEGRQAIGMDDLTGLAQGEISAVAPEPMVIDAVARSIEMRGDSDPARAKRDATNTLRTLAAQGLLTLDNGQLEANASYDRGAIKINGRSLFGG